VKLIANFTGKPKEQPDFFESYIAKYRYINLPIQIRTSVTGTAYQVTDKELEAVEQKSECSSCDVAKE
jgi:hypothetical protein